MINIPLHQRMGYTTKELLGCKYTNSLINLTWYVLLYDMLIGKMEKNNYGMLKFYFHNVKI